MKIPAVATSTGEGLPVTRGCKLLGLSLSGFYEWANRLTNPSDQKTRRCELTLMILKIHTESRCVCGSQRVDVELTMGPGIQVSKPTVEKIMRRNGIYGLPCRREYWKMTNIATASDLVNRDFGKVE